MKKEINKAILLSAGQLLIENQLTVAFAESATAGRICAEFGLVPDAGKFLKGGIVCYDATLKESLLGVPDEQINTFTPESNIVTCSITAGVKKLIPADIHIGCTGLTCPGGSETPEKPVGTMFLFGIRDDKLLFSERSTYDGDPEEIVIQTVERVAELLTVYLETHLKN
jgi:nicotinamide-nucleotide amidase